RAREFGKRGSYTQTGRNASPLAGSSRGGPSRGPKSKSRAQVQVEGPKSRGRSGAAGRSGRAPRLEGGEGHRLARIAVRPQDELERLIIGLAGGDRRLDHGGTLRVARARAAGEAKRMAKH